MAEPRGEIELRRHRIRYSRGRELRYVGNLDLQLIWERTFRRARLPIAFSQGFNPRPRFHMAAALPVGFTSSCELLDLWLIEALSPKELGERLRPAVPPGIQIMDVDLVDLRAPALQVQVQAAQYHAIPRGGISKSDLIRRIADLNSSHELPRIWRGKPYDLRPRILLLDVDSESAENQPAMTMCLTAREGATGRPEEVLSALGLDPALALVERTALRLADR